MQSFTPYFNKDRPVFYETLPERRIRYFIQKIERALNHRLTCTEESIARTLYNENYTTAEAIYELM